MKPPNNDDRPPALLNYIKAFLRAIKLGGLPSQIKAVAGALHNRYLALLHPNGAFVRSSKNANIYCNFKDPNYQWYYNKNVFLEQEHEAFSKLLSLKQPGVIVDIGSHWGIFPAMLDADRSLAKKIKMVVCVEPDPQNLPFLRKTVSKIQNFPVKIIESAIGDMDSTIPAFRGGGACLQTFGGTEAPSEISVQVRTLATVLRESGVTPQEVSHIKVDIDGYEPNFFFGNSDLLAEMKPMMLTEYWAKALFRNTCHDVGEYYTSLQNKFFMILCNYPEGNYSLLELKDFDRLNQITQTCVVNIILIPRDLAPESDFRKMFTV